MKVLGKNVSVRVTTQANNVTAGGLYITSAGDEGVILRGTVELVGESALESVKSGDVVRFSKFNSSKIPNLNDSKTNGDMYIVGMEYILLVE